ncbi:hypothetical protein BDV93DRAFT_71870 [Ceratobasidium sp. AG-I]|nr:hypothetical protein BDV93DRAFT_71870 [Ceratobasidium sp. AG-I]
MLQLTEVVSALSSMARRLSLSVPASGACISRRRPSLVTLPSFGITPRSLEQSFPLSSHSASQVQCEPRSDASDEVAPDAQCYLTSNRWSFMNERFFSERTSLELLGRGLVGEVWYEQVCSAENELVPVVTKLYDYQLPVGTLGLHVELFLYASWDHLRPLQGKYVPIIIGTFSAPGGKTALLMEPPSQAGWREASMLDTDEVKDKVIAAYAAIHAQGVLHNDVELRHILIGDEGTVQIID